jgi:hypothetical protein
MHTQPKLQGQVNSVVYSPSQTIKQDYKGEALIV